MPSTTEFRITIINVFLNYLQGGFWLRALMFLAAELTFKLWLIMIELPKSLTVNLYTASEGTPSHFCSFHCNITVAHMTKNILVLQYPLIRKHEMVIVSMLGYIGINCVIKSCISICDVSFWNMQPTVVVYNICQQFLKPNNLLLSLLLLC